MRGCGEPEVVEEPQMHGEADAYMQAPAVPADGPTQSAARSPKRPSQSGRLYEAGDWKDWMKKRRATSKMTVRPAPARPTLAPQMVGKVTVTLDEKRNSSGTSTSQRI